MIDAVIDISHFQGTPDFGTVAQSGIIGVVHKATQGTGYTDPTYITGRTSALAAGLLWGAYHFGTGGGSGAAQAEFFLNVARPEPSTLVAIDFESSQPQMTVDELIDFVETVQKALNRWPVVYGGPGTLFQMLGSAPNATLAQCPLWVAEYTSAPQPSGIPAQIWPKWTLWQYTEKGSVPGISGTVDRDRFNGTEEELRAWW